MTEEGTTELLESIEVADLVTVTDGGVVATFLPLLFDPARGAHGSLLGHVARKNDQWKRLPLGEALVIAHGHNAYVSPSWYATKREHGRVVPTWNYTTAHIYGRLHVHDDPAWVGALVRRLTERHESRRVEPWSVDDMPVSFHEGQLRAIVGVELEVTRIEAKAKLSQNRSDADVDGVIEGLEGDGLTAAAEAVRRTR